MIHPSADTAGPFRFLQPPSKSRRRPIGLCGWLLAAACSLALLPAFAQTTKLPLRSEAAAVDERYVAERTRLLAEIERWQREGNHAQVRATREALHRLAESKGDLDLARRMDVERIASTHDDAAIEKSLLALDAIRSEVGPEASPELQEALARVYGNLHFDVGHFALALRHQLEALAATDRLPSGGRQARLYRLVTIADLYNAMGLPTEALRYTEMGLALAGTAPSASRRSLLVSRAQAHIEAGDFASASRTLTQIDAMGPGDSDSLDTLRIANVQANLQLAIADPTRAMQAVTHLQTLAEQRGGTYYRTRAQLLHGQALILGGDLATGLREMDASIASFERLGQMVDVLDGLTRQIEVLRGQGAWQQAVAAMDRRQALWKRLFRSEQTRAIAELEAKHRAEAREQRIDALAAQVELGRARLRAERLLMGLLGVLGLLALCIAGLLFLSRRRTRRERDLLSYAARHDPLTGTYSRYEFHRRLQKSEQAAAGRAEERAVLLLDLDNFKSVNDHHGHEAGDAVLRHLVSVLRDALRNDDEIYRWGGEEFLLLLAPRPPATLEQDVSSLCGRLHRAPLEWHEQPIVTTVSGGLVGSPLALNHSVSVTDAIRWADAALYIAKQRGRDRVIQVHITESGMPELAGRRPIDVAQLQDWERKDWVALTSLLPSS